MAVNERIGERHPHVAGVAETMKKRDSWSFSTEANILRRQVTATCFAENASDQVPIVMMMFLRRCRRHKTVAPRGNTLP